MSGSPPLRFLAIVLGGWAAVRTAILAPPWSTPPADAASAAPSPRGPAGTPATGRAPPPAAPPARAASRAAPAAPPPRAALRPPSPPAGHRLPAVAATALEATGETVAAATPPSDAAPLLPPPPQLALPAGGGRRSVSAWSFVRQGRAASLAPGGLLGASQAGVRLAYRLNGDRARPLALSARVSAPLQSAASAEVAFGVDWRPSRRAPVHLLIERRQALGGEGRSAFGATVHGGVSDSPLGRFRIHAYAQVGVVGTRSRDPFADGSIRLSLPLGERARLGAGAWAAAQPGLSRLDLGPQAAFRLPLAGRAVTLAADWRVRVAGRAEPGSGPTLTVATDF